MPSSTPFQLLVTGKAEIPHPAERAAINVSVSSSGPNKASVSDEVVTTAKHIEKLLGAICPHDLAPEAKAQTPLAHWSKTSLSSTSHIPYNYKKPDSPLPRQYNASITFDIRFREFNALGSFGTKVSSLSHVEVQNITWNLTDATEKSFRSQLRKLAARDAMEKAQDYCDVLGCTNVRAVELQEGDVRSSMSANAGFNFGAIHQSSFGGGGGVPGGAGLFGSSANVVSRARRVGAQDGGEDERTEELSFDAQEVKMAMDVTIRFHADHAV